jgi:hypothetical protein
MAQQGHQREFNAARDLCNPKLQIREQGSAHARWQFSCTSRRLHPVEALAQFHDQTAPT